MKCRLCDSTASPYAAGFYEHKGRAFSLFRCSSCGIVFVDPFPDEAEVREFYDEKYFTHDFSFGIIEGDYLASEAARQDEYRRVLSRIARLTDGRRLLEVGCAAGTFLKEARSQGWKVVGVDVSEWAVKTARERFDLDVRLGNLQDIGFPDSSFDAVFFSDLLEHLPDPVAFLEEVARVVKRRDDGGVVVAKVPTYINSFYYRWARRMARLTRLDKKEGSLMSILKLSNFAARLPPYHLFEHNPRTVRDTFTRAGLNVFDEMTTLMVPEFLRTRPYPPYKIALAVFSMLKLFIESFGLPGGHVFIYARRDERNA